MAERCGVKSPGGSLACQRQPHGDDEGHLWEMPHEDVEVRSE